MDVMEQVSRTAFLGPEFLLWLWWRCEEDDGHFTIGEDAVELAFDNQIMLESHLAEAETSRLTGGSPAYSPEAHKALQMGKSVRRALLRLTKGEREWVFLADGPTFRISGVRIPALLTREDDEKFHERLYLIEELEDCWFGLYRQFLEVRLTDAWTKVHATMRAWVEAPTADERG